MTLIDAADCLDSVRLKLELKAMRTRGCSPETAPVLGRIRWKCEALTLAANALREKAHAKVTP